MQNANTLLAIGSTIAFKLNPQKETDYSNKMGPLFMGPWVVVEHFTNGKTYRVRILSTKQESQVTHNQVKVLDVPPVWEGEGEEYTRTLPGVGRVEFGEGVIVPQIVRAGEEPGDANASLGGFSVTSKESNEATPRRRTPQEQVEGSLHA